MTTALPTYLFLDDERVPQGVFWMSLPDDGTWHIVRSFDQFCSWIQNNGMPDFISFDHDLGFDEDGQERNGSTCAKWLVEWCMDHDARCPPFVVHSRNPEGAVNIGSLLDNFRRFQSQSTAPKRSL